MSGQHDWTRIADNAPLMAASAQATAGFSSMAVADLDPASKATLMVSMFVGGDAGSTAGGIKLVRMLLVFQLIGLAVVRTALPERAVVGLRVYDQALEDAQVHRMLTIVFLFAAVVLVTWLGFLAYGYPALDSLFDVVSATATTGLSTGVTSSDLATPLKILLCMDMLMGRLEILTVVILFFPATWFGRRMNEE
jgi:trk system potassium uptake protein